MLHVGECVYLCCWFRQLFLLFLQFRERNYGIRFMQDKLKLRNKI
jgi:hypothetical protein